MAEKPKRIRVDRAEGWLEMDWPDDGVLRVRLPDVRKACPCALCEDVRTKQDKQLQMITEEQIPSIICSIHSVEMYAIPIGDRRTAYAKIYYLFHYLKNKHGGRRR